VKRTDFTYDLPVELIAQAPLPERSASRLLLLPPAPAGLEDRRVRELPQLLQPGDLLVFNDTRVIPARLHGRKQETGGRVEILVERLQGNHHAKAQLGVSKSPPPGTRIALDAGGEVEVLGRDGEFYQLRLIGDESFEQLLLRAGRLPLPPYIEREPDSADAERYQTLFARQAGAVAAPTAGLHFDAALLDALAARGVQFGHVTLHVGAGTFQPMRAERVDEHQMHSEWLNVGAELVEQVRRTRAAGGRVIAVGTTVVRALETASMEAGELQPYAGDTTIFIFPGRRVRSIDALLTNFHLPESTLLMLVTAFGGYERVMAAYRHAVAERYRFFSYGDAMLIFPEAQP
jgi:S-adenosylmethionine:tRNA ribosyltransferase-isomerase